MDEGISRYRSRYFPKPIGTRRQPIEGQDFRTKLWDSSDTSVETESLRSCLYAETIREAAPTLKDGVAFQSIAVASLQTLRRVLFRQRKAAGAAISLAQGEKLERMVQDSEATFEAIAGVLNTQGSHMLSFNGDEQADQIDDNSWWFALTEAIETIEDATTRILSLAAGQPKGGPARRLSSIVVRLLRAQYQELMAEADAWIT